MAVHCKQCGAELFEGQRFCRVCGAPTGVLTGADLPTQLLPHQQQGGAPTATVPLAAGRNTDPVYAAGTAYRPAHTAAVPARRKRRWGRVLFFVALFVVALSVGGALLAVSFVRSLPRPAAEKMKIVKAKPPRGTVAPAPPGASAEEFDDEGAEVTGDKTVITRSYPLGDGGTFKIENASGGITVEGWDEPRAEVRVIKRGETAEERAGVEIRQERSGDSLSFKTEADEDSRVREVQYEVKLPRELRRLELNTRNGDVRLAGVEAEVAVSVQGGNLALEGVGGKLSAKTLNGNAGVKLGAADQPQVVNVVNGNITLTLSPETNVHLKAESLAGRVEADGELGLTLQKTATSQHAAGRIGKGGQPLVLKAINGNVRIKQ